METKDSKQEVMEEDFESLTLIFQLTQMLMK